MESWTAGLQRLKLRMYTDYNNRIIGILSKDSGVQDSGCGRCHSSSRVTGYKAALLAAPAKSERHVSGMNAAPACGI